MTVACVRTAQGHQEVQLLLAGGPIQTHDICSKACLPHMPTDMEIFSWNMLARLSP